MNEEILDIVDENDQIIGQEPRTAVHSQGLKHREVHVWFFNNKGQVLFQIRSKNVETSAGLLDATVGGHVDLGNTYLQSAVKEAKEEAGLDIKEENLIFLGVIYLERVDENGLINNAFKGTYAYEFNDSLDRLIPEKGKSDGFKWVYIKELFNLSDNDKHFAINAKDKEYVEKIFGGIQKIMNEE
ncbi:NUDIX domain-containing protein [Patescibacteria group bacterium]|nr:NUDIX domain-containing protein [Patescibacteria group bacterium]